MNRPDDFRSRYHDIKKRLGKHSRFPNTSTLAEFRHHSQTIHLHHVKQSAFQDDLRRKDWLSLRLSAETIFHEITNWADMIGTQGFLLATVSIRKGQRKCRKKY